MQSAEGSTINIWREVVQAFLVLAAVLFLVWVAAFATGCDGAATGKADLVTVEAQLATMPVDATIHIFRTQYGWGITICDGSMDDVEIPHHGFFKGTFREAFQCAIHEYEATRRLIDEVKSCGGKQ